MGLLDAPARLSAIETQRAVALRPWLAALANRYNAPAPVVCLGDSISEGMGATAWNQRWVARFGQLLRARFPTPGAAGPAFGTNTIPAYTLASATLPAPFTYGGSGLSGNTGYGLRRLTAQLNASFGPHTSAGGTGLFSGLTSCKVAYHTASNGGTLGIAINGGAVTNINTNGSGQELLSSSFALTGGTDSIVISHVTGTIEYFEGLHVWNGDETKGLNIYDAGHYGYTSTNWTDPAGIGSAADNWAPWMATIQPALVVIELGTNDWNGGIPAATFQANIQTIIAAINAKCTIPPSIVLLAVPERSGVASGTWASYIAAMQAIASANPTQVSVFDATLRFPKVASDTLGLFYDTAHPSNKGHSMLADALGNFVSPR